MVVEPSALFSFDVEEFDAPVSRGRPMTMDEQMELGGRGQARTLDLLATLGLRATMFTTANFALAHPGLQRRAALDHEIASHAHFHASFRTEDLATSRDVLRRTSGQEVLGFRRPRLQSTDPAAIAAAGYSYDSSVNPVWLPGRYANLRAPRVPHRTGAIIEVPISASPRLRVPLFWLAWKNLPMVAVRDACERCLAADGVLNLFWHPWEFVDLAGQGLPLHMRRVDGERMCDRFAGFAEWMRARARIMPIGDWLAGAPMIAG
ncbi:MAG: polysaccharide deacetylase family protein [Planctomycetota bacterium]